MRRSCSGRHMRLRGMSANEARVALPVIAAMPTALMIAFMFGNVIGMDFTGLLLSFMLLACVLTLYANVVMALLGEFQRREESE